MRWERQTVPASHSHQTLTDRCRQPTCPASSAQLH